MNTKFCTHGKTLGVRSKNAHTWWHKPEYHHNEIKKIDDEQESNQNSEHFFSSVLSLAYDLFPEPERRIPKNFFMILFTLYAIEDEKRLPYDPFSILKRTRDRAWLGYSDTPALIRAMRADLPRSPNAHRSACYFEEISEKRSKYLFLPVVSRIDRHQAGRPVPLSLKLDAAQDAFGHVSAAGVARKAFASAPQRERERDAFLLALMAATWGKGPGNVTKSNLLTEVSEQLRLLYVDPTRSLGLMRPPSGTNPAATRAVEMADEVSRLDPSLWLETLFIVERWHAGPQYFASAIEVVGGSTG